MDLITIDTFRVVSILTGILYLLVFVAGLLSIARAVDHPDYLTKAAQKSGQVRKAALFQFLMAVFYTGIALLLFPVLKIHNQTLALGFFGFRIIAALLVVAGTIILLILLRVSKKYSQHNSSTTVNYKPIGDKLKTARDFVNHVAMITMLCISSLMLYTVTLQSGLIPTWLSLWGIVGAAIAMLASIFVWLKYVKIISPTYMLLNIPLALQEFVFAVWLLWKGFETIM
jgi:hypothetical protein